MSSSLLPFFRLPPTISQIYAKAMYDPNSTEDSIISQKQLAYALGYPMNWRVERKIVVQEEVIDDDIDNDDDKPCPSNSNTANLYFCFKQILAKFCTVHVSADSHTP